MSNLNHFEADGSLHIGSIENPVFSTQFSNSEDRSGFTNTSEVHLSSSSKCKSKKSRGGNFTVEEDLLIVSAWVNTSLDAIHGNEQKHQTYWERLSEYYHKYQKSSSYKRTQISLMNRWSSIQLATNKFCGCYSQIESRHQSGINEQDKIANAKELYQELYKIKFQYEHCWNVLRLQPKWIEDCQKKKPMKKKDKALAPLESQVNLEDDSTPSSEFVDIERPLGRKAEKDKKRKNNMGNDDSSSFVNLLQQMREEKKLLSEKKMELLEKVYSQEQEKLVVQQEQLRLEQMREDERIMTINTNGMPQMLASFYHQRQAEIIQRMSKSD